MDGYSVSEAASVLGVPIERVWELLARGVLAGAPEGETGMRVFLQPRSGEVPTPEAPKRTNGDDGGAEPGRELSPFRELLTEFRNLTERYGQALLALGESRGEVASLRSRVDMLEARMDLRLPGGGPATWSSGPVPYAPDHTIVPTAPPRPIQPSSPAADGDEGSEEEHRSRARGPRRATESFAEALARADDPSAPELPAPESPGEAPAAAQDEPALEAEAVLPRELPAADTVPVADEAEPAAAEAEPAADEAQSAADEAEPEPAEMPPVADEAAPAGAETPPASPPVVKEAEPGHGPVAGQAELEAVDDEPVVETPVPEETAADEATDALHAATESEAPAPEAVEETEAGAAGPEEEAAPAAAAPPLEWDADRYTTTIDEPDWFEAEAFDDLTAREAPPQEPASSTQPSEEPPAPAAAEETVMWLGRDRDERDALPGSDDLGEALRALDAIPASDDRVDAPAPGSVGPSPPLPSSALRYRPVTPPGPTTRAYRRLRRIFPS